MELPNDPFMLLSVINTHLRDNYPSFAELCKANGLDESQLKEKLHSAGFDYMPEINQFR